MFEPFEGNYVWNLAVGIALSTGGLVGETDLACRALQQVDPTDEAAASRAFFKAFGDLGDRLTALAAEDEAAGRRHSAGRKHHRAAVYYQTAERMQHPSFAPRREAYAKALHSFDRFLRLCEEPTEKVEVAFDGGSFPGLLMHADRAGWDGPAPCVVFFNGLDSTKEMFYGSGTAQELRRRGIATLIVDTPGSGEALRLRGMTAIVETERWAAACVDHLQARGDIDPERIGLLAWSLGGYYGPRATAYEPRLAFGVAWGANYDWGAVQQRRLAAQGDRPVPHYWEHVQWVWGAEDLDDFIRLAPRITLRGHLDRIRVPFLVVHGEGDRQIPVGYAHDLYRDLVNSPHRELKVFTAREGGIEHCGVDDMPMVTDYICDWIDETIAHLDTWRNR